MASFSNGPHGITIEKKDTEASGGFPFDDREVVTMNRYEYAKELYAEIGVDTDHALEALAKIPISMHCWQGDDINGFEGDGRRVRRHRRDGEFPGKARNPEELMRDIKTAFSVIPGSIG